MRMVIQLLLRSGCVGGRGIPSRSPLYGGGRSAPMSFLICCLFVLSLISLCSSGSAALVVRPAVPFVNVPFDVHIMDNNTEVSIFISRTEECDGTQAISPECKVSKGVKCTFTVRDNEVGINPWYDLVVPEVYICTGKAFSSLTRSVQLSVVGAMPRYVKRDITTVIRFNSTVPIGTVIGFHRAAACSGGSAIDGLLPFRLGVEREMNVTWGVRGVIYLCAELPSDTGRLPPVPASALLVVPPYRTNSTRALRHTNESFLLDAVDSLVWATFSQSEMCDPTLQEPVGSNTLQVVDMSISVRRGVYYMCHGWLYYKDRRVYSPSENRVTIREYGVQPRTLYSRYETRMVYTMDAASSVADGVNLALSFYKHPNCSEAVRVGEASQALPLVLVAKHGLSSGGSVVSLPIPGTYYACLDGSTDAYPRALAGAVTVLVPPTVSLDEANVVSGLDVTVRLSGHDVGHGGVMTVGLSMTPGCEELSSKAEVRGDESLATIRVPEDALASMTLCLTTPSPVNPSTDEEPDWGYRYPVKKVATRRYRLRHRTLFVGVAETIYLDSDVSLRAGTKGYFSLDNCATVSGRTYLMNVTALYGVVFGDAGRYVLCVGTPDDGRSAVRSYSNVGSIVVYGPAVLAPSSVVKGVPTTVKVSGAPAGAPVTVSEGPGCKPSVVEGDATAEGEASVVVMRATVGELVVCIGYRDVEEGPWELKRSSMLIVADVRVFPEVVFAGMSNRVNFIVPDKASLDGLKVFFTETADEECDGLAYDGGASAITVTEGGPAHVVYTPPGVGAQRLCLWKRDGYGDIGIVQAQPQLELVTDSPVGVVGLPLGMRFQGEALSALQPTRFLVSSSAESCQTAPGGNVEVRGEGKVDPTTGRAVPFVARNAGESHVCVGWGDVDESYYLYGGNVSVQGFTVSSLYAVRGSTNNFVASPLLAGASLFLVRCPTDSCTVPVDVRMCEEASERYYTGPTIPLKGVSLGEYALCQQDEGLMGVAAARQPVTVIDPFTASFNASVVRKHIPLRLTLGGGDLHRRNSNLTVYVVPPEVGCAKADGSYDSFPFAPHEVSRDIVIVKAAARMEGARLCVGASAYDRLPTAVFDILHYMTPATLVAGRSVRVESSGLRRGAVRVSTVESCADSILSGTEAAINDYISILEVGKCESRSRDLTDVYYCECEENGRYVMRGTMRLVHLDACPGGKHPAMWPVSVPPARPVRDYGIDQSVLSNPFLSTGGDCSEAVGQTRVAMTPRYDRNLSFFVCTDTPRDPGYFFTSELPTLSVENFRAMKTSVHGRVDSSSEALRPAEFVLNHATGTLDTYLSDCGACSEKVAALPGLAAVPANDAVTLVGVAGVKCVCVVGQEPGSISIPVAEILVVNPPSLKRVDPAAVPSAPLHARLQTPVFLGSKPLYSLVPGEDAKNPLSYLHNSEFRGVYISDSACASVLAGNSVGFVRPSGSVVLGPTVIPGILPSVSLCVGTPAGNLSVASDLKVSSDIIFPSEFVLGVETEVYIPLLPNSAFRVRRNASCTGEDVAPFFTTDEEARGNISFKDASTVGLPPAAVCTLCQEVFDGGAILPRTVRTSTAGVTAYVASGGKLLPIAQIETFSPVYYNVRGSDVLVGVPSVVYLTDDLHASSLIPGFSTESGCLHQDESYGSWAVVGGDDASSARRVSVVAHRSADSIYFCATVPVNKSVVSVPLASSLRFVPPVSMFPSTVESCKATPLESCRAPGSSHRQTVVRVIKGDCCSPTGRGATVGSADEGSDGKCRLKMDPKKVQDYPADTAFSICAWDLTDDSYCVTLGGLRVSGGTCGSGSAWGTLGFGVMITIIVLAVLLFLLLLLFAVCVLRRKCLKAREEGQLVVADKMVSENLDLSCIAESSPDPECLGSGNNPLLLEFCPGEGSLDTTVGMMMDGVSPCGDFVGGGAAAGRMSWSVPEDLECDDRDQIALQEARDRYNMALAFTDGIERIRLRAKELELQCDYSGDFSSYECPVSKGLGVGSMPLGAAADTPDLLSTIHMMRVSRRERMRLQAQEEIEVSLRDAGSEAHFVTHDASRLTSCDMVSSTTTQHFYDDSAFVHEGEASRRLRLVNWEEEEWQAIVDAEFSDYVCLQQTMRSIPLPLPQAIVLPFSTAASCGASAVGCGEPSEAYGASATTAPVYAAPTLRGRRVPHS